MDRPIVKVLVGALLGVVASLSISFGFVAVLAALAGVVAFGIAWKSQAAISGALCGFGLTWLVLGGGTYLACASGAAQCDGGEGFLPFLVLAAVIFAAGVWVGVRAALRERARQAPDGGP